MGASTYFRVSCINGMARWQFPFEVTKALAAPLFPLTNGQVTEIVKQDITEEASGDAVAAGDIIKQRKAVCVFKYTPATGDPQLHRISIPAVEIGDTGVYSEPDGKGEIIPATKTGTSPGKDGGELATLFETAMGLTAGSFKFISGKVYQGSTRG